MAENKYIKAAEYCLELKKWAGKMSLVSKGDEGKLISRHFLDAMIIERMIPPGATVMDVGGGNGFPAIPLALFRQDIKIVSFESKMKKAVFLNNIKNDLNLTNYKIANCRIENNPSDYKRRFNVIISRAYKDISGILKTTEYYAANIAIYLIYNKLEKECIVKIKNDYQQLINTVDKFDYYLPDNRERQMAIIKFKDNKISF